MPSNLLGDANALKPGIHPHYNSKTRYTVVLFSQIYIYIYIYKIIYSQSQLFQSKILMSNVLHVSASFKFITRQKY